MQMPKTTPITIQQAVDLSLTENLVPPVIHVKQYDHGARRIGCSLYQDSMIDMMYSLGLRIGEVAALNVEDYSGTDHSVLIRGKGERESVLYLSSEEVREKLKKWIGIREEMESEDYALFLNLHARTLGTTINETARAVGY